MVKTFNTKNSQVPLYTRITVNGKRIEISLKRKIAISNWDANKQRARGNKSTSKLLNIYLDQIQNKLYDCYHELIAEGKLITPQNIKTKFLGKDEQHYSLLGMIEYHNENIEITLRWGTLKNYYTTERYIKEFLNTKLKTSDIYLRELSYQFVIDFEQYLRSYIPKDHQKHMGNNTSNTQKNGNNGL